MDHLISLFPVEILPIPTAPVIIKIWLSLLSMEPIPTTILLPWMQLISLLTTLIGLELIMVPIIEITTELLITLPFMIKCTTTLAITITLFSSLTVLVDTPHTTLLTVMESLNTINLPLNQVPTPVMVVHTAHMNITTIWMMISLAYSYWLASLSWWSPSVSSTSLLNIGRIDKRDWDTWDNYKSLLLFKTNSTTLFRTNSSFNKVLLNLNSLLLTLNNNIYLFTSIKVILCNLLNNNNNKAKCLSTLFLKYSPFNLLQWTCLNSDLIWKQTICLEYL